MQKLVSARLVVITSRRQTSETRLSRVSARRRLIGLTNEHERPRHRCKSTSGYPRGRATDDTRVNCLAPSINDRWVVRAEGLVPAGPWTNCSEVPARGGGRVRVNDVSRGRRRRRHLCLSIAPSVSNDRSCQRIPRPTDTPQSSG